MTTERPVCEVVVRKRTLNICWLLRLRLLDSGTWSGRYALGQHLLLLVFRRASDAHPSAFRSDALKSFEVWILGWPNKVGQCGFMINAVFAALHIQSLLESMRRYFGLLLLCFFHNESSQNFQSTMHFCTTGVRYISKRLSSC